MGYTEVFVLILIVHFLADFALQTHEQATNKGHSNVWLIYHVGTYTAIWSLVFFILPVVEDMNTFFGWITFVFLIGIPHYIVDWCTSRIGKPFWKNGDLHNGFVVVGFDQVIHYLCLWVVIRLFIGLY